MEFRFKIKDELCLCLYLEIIESSFTANSNHIV